MTFTTVGADGVPTSRTLIVKEVDDRGIHVSSSRSSRKGHDLAAHPVATILFFWRPLGRQLEASGAVEELDEETSRRDWSDRPGAVGENPDWRVWRLVPDRVELMQARHDRRHTRVEYRREGDGWHRRVLTSSEVSPGSTS